MGLPGRRRIFSTSLKGYVSELLQCARAVEGCEYCGDATDESWEVGTARRLAEIHRY